MSRQTVHVSKRSAIQVSPRLAYRVSKRVTFRQGINIVAGAGPAIPHAPTNLSATPLDREVDLTWTAASGADTYNIYRSLTSGSGYSLIDSGIVPTSYADTGRTNGVTYFYIVTGVNGLGEGPQSNEVMSTPSSVFTPADIVGLRLWLDAQTIMGLGDGDQITLWQDQSTHGNDATNLLHSVNYATNAINGLPAAHNPNFGILGSTSVGLGITGNGARSLLIVMNLGVFADVFFDGAWSGGLASQAWGVGVSEAFHWGGGFDVPYNTSFSTQQWILAEYTYDGTYINTWENGAQTNTNITIPSGALNSANIGWALFNWENGDRASAGYIASAILYDSVDLVTQAKAREYLRTEYALF